MEYSLSGITAEIDVDKYILNYHTPDAFIEYCKQCNRYGACWACPPFDFDVDVYLRNYKSVRIIGTKITLSDALINECAELERCKNVSYRIIGEVRRDLDNKLLALERRYPNSRAFFAGSCRFCKREKCMRISKKPCLYPDKIRPSLESLGFDVAKTSLQLLKCELKWGSKERLPEYFVLVSGFFMNNLTGRSS
ncbi:MAG: DUF2284 domain-containing protein [Chitinispirillales bacterium]|jgi:predicted metal-binding protein|nr:DUF2284 domain-containing protein [Chitinispirillales bacterium]